MNNNFYESPDKDSLEHFGILGMKWGVRRYQPYSSKPRKSGKKGKEIGEARNNKKIQRQARKDAKRYADAKMFYGEGAGTRRKLLKGELSKKMKDPSYKKAFDDALNKVDYSKSTRRAKSERHRKDATRKVRTTVHKVEAALGVTAIGLAATYYVNNSQRINSTIRRYGNRAVNTMKDKRTRYAAKKALRRMGVKC